MSTPRLPTPAKVLFAGLLLLFASPPADAEDKKPNAAPMLAAMKMPTDAQVVSDPSQLSRALFDVQAQPWKPKTNDATPRGAGAEVFAQVAPGVVVVHFGAGFGTGFVIDPAGWIITNDHVVAGAKVDKATAAQAVSVYVGRQKEDRIELVERGLRAYVYKTDGDKDLALIKVTELPEGFGKLPSLKIAAKTPRVGEDCFAVGHPTAGLLWTLRSGVISGAGKWPAELIDVVVQRLVATDAEKAKLQRELASHPQHTMLISTCGINPGDSGGPLLNKDGEVIAVTNAVPLIRGDVDFAKFSYHVHLEELQAFLKAIQPIVKARSPAPPLFVPSQWPAATNQAWRDLDGDGKNDALLFSAGRDGTVTGFLLDLDQNTVPAKAQKSSPKTVEKPKYDFEFAYQFSPHPRAFYDTDDDGTMDLILCDVDADERVDIVLSLENGQWTRQDAKKAELIDASRFANETQRERFRAIMLKPTQKRPPAPATGKSGAKSRVVLVYKAKPRQDDQGKELPLDMDALVREIRRRIDPSAAQVRVVADSRVEIALLGPTKEDVERIKRRLADRGALEFRVLAHENDTASGIDIKSLLERAKDPKLTPPSQHWVGEKNKPQGLWVPIDSDAASYVKRFHDQAKEDSNGVAHAEGFLTRRVKGDDKEQIEILVIKDPLNVDTSEKGVVLSAVAPTIDGNGNPAIDFSFNREGAKRLGELTRKYQPRPDGFRHRLGIILYGQLTGAPTLQAVLSDRGQITGFAATPQGRKERDDTISVLKSGPLPAQLEELSP